jgi:5-formyltetrahydrofolate cyclo-ligase
METKLLLREKMRVKIKTQKRSERRKGSTIIQSKIFSCKDFLDAKCIMFYVSKGTGEVETGPIIKKALKMGKRVALPVTVVRERTIKPVYVKNAGEPLKKGPYGIYEPVVSKDKRPVRLKDIDLVIVPGLAFDERNNRLGRGQGYYDNFLKYLPCDTPKIGLGFRFQLFKKIPATKKDIPLTGVITD